MNLFRNQNSRFEEELKKQLGDLEYKPSESSWEKIASNLPEDNFEGALAHKADQFELKPGDTIWNRIDARLPAEKANIYKRLFWIIPLSLLFIGSAAYFGKSLFNKPVGLNESKVKTENIQKAEQVEMKEDVKKQGTISSQQLVTGNSNPVLQTPAFVINYAVASLIKKTSADGSLDKKKLANSKKDVVAKHEENNVAGLNVTENVLADGNDAGALREKNKKKNRQPAISKTDKGIDQTEFSGKAGKNDRKNLTAASLSNLENISNTSALSAQSPVAPQPKNEEITGKIQPTGTSVEQLNNKPAGEIKVAQADQKDSTKILTASSKNNNEDGLTGFSISVISGVQYCFNSLSAPANSSLNFSENISLRKKIETPQLDWNGTFLLNYELNKRWRISTGVMISNFSQNFEYSFAIPVNTHSALRDPGAKVFNPSDSIINGNTNSNRIKYTWTEIPVFITYSFNHKSKFGFELMAGVSYGIITAVDASYVSYDNMGVLFLTDKNAFPGVKDNFFVHFNPHLYYMVNDLVSVGVAPTLKYSVTSITANDSWVEQRPYFIGISASLRKKF